MRYRILLLETVADEAMEILKSADDLEVSMALTPAEREAHFEKGGIDAIITRGKGQVRERHMPRLKGLKIVARCGVGLDNIDVAAATAQCIKVINAPNSNANTIAEHTIALLLNVQRKLYGAFNMVKEGRWNDRATYTADELHGKTLGILGMGHIGKKVAKIAEALGMKVIYWSAHKEDVPYPFHDFKTVLGMRPRSVSTCP